MLSTFYPQVITSQLQVEHNLYIWVENELLPKTPDKSVSLATKITQSLLKLLPSQAKWVIAISLMVMNNVLNSTVFSLYSSQLHKISCQEII